MRYTYYYTTCEGGEWRPVTTKMKPRSVVRQLYRNYSDGHTYVHFPGYEAPHYVYSFLFNRDIHRGRWYATGGRVWDSMFACWRDMKRPREIVVTGTQFAAGRQPEVPGDYERVPIDFSLDYIKWVRPRREL